MGAVQIIRRRDRDSRSAKLSEEILRFDQGLRALPARVNHFFHGHARNQPRHEGKRHMANSLKSATFLMESRLAEVSFGDADELYELGIAYSSGAGGIDVDLIEAHKWLNLAALSGSIAAQEMRAEISEEMTAREIVEAQKQARAWLAVRQRRAA
jgi:uncharacterized protein